MADTSHGTGGLTFHKSKRVWPNEMNIFVALILIILIFEALGQLLPYMKGQSMLFDFNTRRDDTILNMARIKIIILQVSIIGIIALGVTQVIITGGIDLSSGSVVGAAAMIAMSFAQTELVNGNPNPKAIFGNWAMDLPIIVPLLIGLGCGLIAGAVNGLLIAYTRIPPFIATLGMMVSLRGVAKWWSRGNPISFPTEEYADISNGNIVDSLTFGLFSDSWTMTQLFDGQNPAIYFLLLAVLFHFVMKYTVYGKHTYAIGSNEDAARMSGINVSGQKVLVYAIAGTLAGFAAILLTSRNVTAQAGMGFVYELDAIAMAVIGGVSLTGGRGSIIGTVLGALIFGVIISGFTYLKLDAFYQEMVKGAIIVAAVVLDQWRQQRSAAKA
ncbi:MAG: ABC transporter permease [Rhodobacter sp.]|nr:ABC transporter permease [Rhodobacter sp.]